MLVNTQAHVIVLQVRRWTDGHLTYAKALKRFPTLEETKEFIGVYVYLYIYCCFISQGIYFPLVPIIYWQPQKRLKLKSLNYRIYVQSSSEFANLRTWHSRFVFIFGHCLDCVRSTIWRPGEHTRVLARCRLSWTLRITCSARNMKQDGAPLNHQALKEIICWKWWKRLLMSSPVVYRTTWPMATYLAMSDLKMPT